MPAPNSYSIFFIKVLSLFICLLFLTSLLKLSISLFIDLKISVSESNIFLLIFFFKKSNSSLLLFKRAPLTNSSYTEYIVAFSINFSIR